MTTTASANSASIEHGCLAFTSARIIQSFPRHDTIKLDDENFVQWQQHIRLIIEGYELTDFLEGRLLAPPRFVQSQKGSLVPNPDALVTTCDVWNTDTRLFAAVIGAKLSRILHDLNLLKKGNLSIKEYVAKIQNTYALIKASSSQILEAEKVEIILVALTPEFDAVLTLASFSSKTLSFQHLVDVLLEYEN
ncbi:hypothetical protein J1N35_041644 [Gossypium stocksii]|uniref:Retrotransposon Copia-like N-terminal domain-containing protein n=1 Tax=Gossypium stocksii TaxID=47602 RepID=A0A9D3UG56_9ROSI|nr:hypothetical protein J1N35_041644 [Gossypium stocksii]